MALFKIKSATVEAVQFEGEGDACRVFNWLARNKADITGWEMHDGDVTVPTVEGPKKAVETDWIVRDGKGRYWVYAHQDFIKEFEDFSR